MTERRGTVGWAVFSALLVILFQQMNVEQVGEIGHTLFGTTSHGIWVSTPELFCLVIVAYLLGELTAAGIIMTSLALSFAVQSPAFVAATIGSKVIALGAVAVVRRLGAGMLPAMLVAVEVDVIAFALWAHLPQIIGPSLAIRLVLWAAMVAVDQVALTVRESHG